MERVTVAELKARLSHYLREVRAGKSFTVVSRDIPVATLAPHESNEIDDLEIIPPEPDAPPLFERVFGRPPTGLPDAVELLRAERDAADARLAELFEPRRRHEAETEE